METSLNKKKNVQVQSVFKNKNYLLLFIGQFISKLGDQIYDFGLAWYVLSITHSSVKMGILLMIGLLPPVIMGPFTGIIADKFSRRKIMIIMDLARFFIVSFLAVLLYCNKLYIWVLYIAAAVLGICGSIFNPASDAIVPNIVEKDQLVQASSLEQFYSSICNVIGMLLGGILFGLIGINMIFIFNAVSYFISGVCEFGIRIPRSRLVSQMKDLSFRKVISELGGGFKFLAQNKGLRIVFLYFSFLSFLIFPVGMIYIPYMFNVILKSTSFQCSLVQASFFIGIVIGAMIIPKIMTNKGFVDVLFRGVKTIFLIELLVAIPMLPIVTKQLSLLAMVVYYFAISAVMGLAMCSMNIPFYVMFQSRVPDEVRGRVMGLVGSLIMAVTPISYLLGGYLAQYIPLYIIGFATSLLIGLSILIMLRFKKIMQ